GLVGGVLRGGRRARRLVLGCDCLEAGGVRLRGARRTGGCNERGIRRNGSVGRNGLRRRRVDCCGLDRRLRRRGGIGRRALRGAVGLHLRGRARQRCRGRVGGGDGGCCDRERRVGIGRRWRRGRQPACDGNERCDRIGGDNLVACLRRDAGVGDIGGLAVVAGSLLGRFAVVGFRRGGLRVVTLLRSVGLAFGVGGGGRRLVG